MAALAAPSAIAINTETNPRMQQHRTLGKAYSENIAAVARGAGDAIHHSTKALKRSTKALKQGFKYIFA